MKLWDIIAFFNWLFSMVLRLVAKLVAPIPALFVDRRNNPIWGIRDWPEGKVPYWEAANPFGNAAHNCFSKEVHGWHSYGAGDREIDLEPGFKWRYRRSVGAGNYISFRVTWGKVDLQKGKNEVYIGWVPDRNNEWMRPSLQVRPIWPLVIVIGIAIWLLGR